VENGQIVFTLHVLGMHRPTATVSLAGSNLLTV